MKAKKGPPPLKLEENKLEDIKSAIQNNTYNCEYYNSDKKYFKILFEHNDSKLYLIHYAASIGAIEFFKEASKVTKITRKEFNKITPSGDNILLIAAEKGHAELVRLLLENGANVEACDKNNLTPLLIAVEKGHSKTVEAFLEKGISIEHCNSDGLTALLVAAFNGNAGVVKFLIEKGANIKGCDKNNITPLVIASYNGNSEVVRLLLENGADIEYCSQTGATILLTATDKGHAEVVRLLLENGADIEGVDKEGCRPLLLAADRGHIDVVKVLIENGANIEAVMLDVKNPPDKFNPLILASIKGHTEVVRLLLENGAKIEGVDKNCCTPLLLAADRGHIDVVKALIENGAKAITTNVQIQNPEIISLLKAQNSADELIKFLPKTKLSVHMVGDQEYNIKDLIPSYLNQYKEELRTTAGTRIKHYLHYLNERCNLNSEERGIIRKFVLVLFENEVKEVKEKFKALFYLQKYKQEKFPLPKEIVFNEFSKYTGLDDKMYIDILAYTLISKDNVELIGDDIQGVEFSPSPN